ncbi:MAG: FeoA family protein, partial [Fimbriimonadales bacterium]
MRGVWRLSLGEVPALWLRATAGAEMDQEHRGMGAAEASGASAGRTLPLTQLPTGAQARIVQVVHDPEGHWRKLSALGIMPGAIL